jgi:hypothetical protein
MASATAVWLDRAEARCAPFGESVSSARPPNRTCGFHRRVEPGRGIGLSPGPVSPARPPNPACDSHRTGLSTRPVETVLRRSAPQYPRRADARFGSTVFTVDFCHYRSAFAVWLSSFAMCPALPGSDYYEDSAPSWCQQPTAGLPATRRRGGQRQDGSHVHHQPIGERGGQLCPGSIAMSTPQAFLMASWSADADRRRSRPPWRPCAANRPISTRLEPAERLRGFGHWFTFVPPSRLACRTRTVWQYRPVPSLSGLLPPSPCVSRVWLPPASPACCDRPEAEPFHLRPVEWRLVAHASGSPQAQVMRGSRRSLPMA